MLRLARLTDYGFVLLTHMARRDESAVYTARDLAAATRLPLPTVSKLLKTLGHAGLLESQRGVAGGYKLARPASTVPVSQILEALEGPIALTLCAHTSGECGIEASCPDRGHWLRINRAVFDALDGVSLAELAQPAWPAASPIPFLAQGLAAKAAARAARPMPFVEPPLVRTPPARPPRAERREVP
jgi:FeS assembly SUF system regulator